MKFTKVQLLDALKAKLTENGKHLSISEKTIKSLSDAHYELLATEETGLDDLVVKILPQYVTLNGNYEKDNADFIKKWNEEHPVKEVKGEEKPAGNNTSEPSETEKKLLERLEALEKANAEHEAATLISAKKKDLLAKFKEKGINDSKWIEKYMNKLNLSKDSDIEQEFKDAEEFYNLSHAKGSGTPGSTGGGSSIKENFAERWKGVNKVLGSTEPTK